MYMCKVVSFAAVIRVVCRGDALRDDSNNGCEGDCNVTYSNSQPRLRTRKINGTVNCWK